MMSIHSNLWHRHTDRRLTCDHFRGFEFKKKRKMGSIPLQQLHGAMVEVELDVGGATRSVRGECCFDSDADLGKVLRVLVADRAGNFEILISESNWDGSLRPSSLPDCKFRISLASALPCDR